MEWTSKGCVYLWYTVLPISKTLFSTLNGIPTLISTRILPVAHYLLPYDHRVGFSQWWTIAVTFLSRCSATPSSMAEINTQPLFNQTVSADYLALIHRFDYLGLINLEIGEEIRRLILNRQCNIENIDLKMDDKGNTNYFVRIILEILSVREGEISSKLINFDTGNYFVELKETLIRLKIPVELHNENTSGQIQQDGGLTDIRNR